MPHKTYRRRVAAFPILHGVGVSIPQCLIVPLLLILAAASTLAQEFRIESMSRDVSGLVTVEYLAASNHYYLLYAGPAATNISQPLGAALGQSGPATFTTDAGVAPIGFYRIQRIPFTVETDVDGDLIDDLFELTHPGILDPLNAADAWADYDQDGDSNFNEYLRGTDLAAANDLPPVIALESPLSGAVHPLGPSMTLQAQASDPAGAIARVDFLVDGQLLGSTTEAPHAFSWTPPSPGSYQLAAVARNDRGLMATSDVVHVAVQVPLPQLAPSQTNTADGSIFLTGQGFPGATLQVSGGDGLVTAAVPTNGWINVEIPLRANRLNRLFACQIAPGGLASPQQPFEILQDSQPPTLHIDFPADEATLTTDQIVIAGRVGDMLSGFAGLSVDVNGLPANVIVGIGPNGTFERSGVPLNVGSNWITAVARDIHGHEISKSIVVHRVIPSGPRLREVSGNLQTAMAGRLLPQPVAVRMTRADGAPFANKLVNFKVIRSDGRLFAGAEDAADEEMDGAMLLQLETDAQGLAQAWWRLGGDAGCGNNRLSVTSRDIADTVYFCASGDPAPPSQINIGSGHGQRVEAGGPAFEPLRAWVSDSCNGVAGVPVTFRVLQGGGLVDGQTERTVTTSLTGHAEARFVLGPAPGNHVVEANFQGNPSGPAIFVLRGVSRREGQDTTYAGVVFDNANQPLGNVACAIEMNGVEAGMAVTDDDGRFLIPGLPGGPGHLHVHAVDRVVNVRGAPVPVGTYPDLAYEILVVPRAANAHPMPVLLPKLNPANAVAYDGTADVTLTVEGIAGLKMFVQAGSMRLRDGSAPSPANPTVLALNQVHHDDVPMPMPDGAAPPFAWTLQPAGATFDPPIRIEYPNMSGLPGGAIAYFLSFNHDTERFEIVAGGHVTDDGATIVTDADAGLTVAGWGCNCPPYSVTGECGNCWGKASQAGASFLIAGLELKKAARKLIDGVKCGKSVLGAGTSCYSAYRNYKDGGASTGDLLGCTSSLKGSAATCLDFLFFSKADAVAGAALPAVDGVLESLDALQCFLGLDNTAGGKAISHMKDVKDLAESITKGITGEERTRAVLDGVCSAMNIAGTLIDRLQKGEIDPPAFINEMDPIMNAIPQQMSDIESFRGDITVAPDTLTAQLEAATLAVDLFQEEWQTIEAALGDVALEDFELGVGVQWQVPDGMGGFLIPNIQAPDLFGPNGPGTRPDFLSDDCIRLRGISNDGGQTRYVYSDLFRLRAGETFIVDSLHFSDEPPPIPVSLSATVDTPTLTTIGQTTQIHVSALLGNGQTVDVTGAAACTIYRNSNRAIVGVDADGLVTARSKGMAYVTVSNEGVTAVVQVDVSPGDPLTTIRGLIVDTSNQPVAGAVVRLPGAAAETISRADGSFELASVPTEFGLSNLVAELSGPVPQYGAALDLEWIPGGITDAGIIVLSSLCEIVDPCLDSDGDLLPDHLESALGLDPDNADSNGNGVPDGDEDLDDDGLSNVAELFAGTPLAEPLISSLDITRRISVAGQIRVTQFDAQAGELVIVTAGWLGAGRPHLQLHGPDGILLAEDDGSRSWAAVVTFIAPQTGTYYVHLGERGNDGTGLFRLGLVRFPGQQTVAEEDQGGPLLSGQEALARIGYGELDVFWFDAQENEVLLANAGWEAGSRPHVQLYGPDGSLLVEDDGSRSWAAVVQWTAQQSGRHWLVVRGRGDDSQNNVFRVGFLRLPGDVVVSPGDEGGLLVSGQETNARIDYGEHDVFWFDAEADQRILANAGYLAVGRPHLQLFDSDGTLLVEDDGSRPWSAVVEWIAPQSGRYYLIARARGDDSNNCNFRLGLSLLPHDVTVSEGDEGGLLVSGQETTARLGYGEHDIFWIDAQPGESLLFNAGWQSGNRPHLQLYGPDGILLVEDDRSRPWSAVIEWAVQQTGRHYLAVRERLDDGSGNVFRVGALRLPGNLTVSEADEGGPLAKGADVNGSLGYGELDAYTLQPTQGERVHITVAGISGSATYTVQCFDEQGSLLSPAPGTTSNIIDLLAPSTGTYYVVVRDIDDNQPGSYRIQYWE